MRKNFILILMMTIIAVISTSCKASESNSDEQIDSPSTTYTIQTKALTDKITDENKNEVFNVSYIYPIITSPQENTNLNTLNAAFKAEADEYIKKIKTGKAVENAKKISAAAKAKSSEFYPHSSTVSYVEQYNKNNIVSFLKSQEDYTGGTKRSYCSTGRTYNLETGKEMTLNEIFEAENSALSKIISNCLQKEAEKNKELFGDKTNFTEQKVSEKIKELKWYLTSEGLVFLFNPNTIVPNSSETIQFTYNYEENKAMFKIQL